MIGGLGGAAESGELLGVHVNVDDRNAIDERVPQSIPIAPLERLVAHVQQSTGLPMVVIGVIKCSAKVLSNRTRVKQHLFAIPYAARLILVQH